MILLTAATMTPEQMEQIEAFMNAKLLGNVENINATVSNLVTVLAVAISIIGAIATFTMFQRKRIVNEVMAQVHTELDDAKQRIVRQADEKANIMIHEEIEAYKKQAREEEYFRNMMFNDLNRMLAREIHVNDTNNLPDVFALHADRYEIIAKLTSGRLRETQDALDKLVNGNYEIVGLVSLQKYIDILEKSKSPDWKKMLREWKENLENKKKKEVSGT